MNREHEIAISLINLLSPRICAVISPILDPYLGTSRVSWQIVAHRKISPNIPIANLDAQQLNDDPSFILKVCRSYWSELTRCNQEWTRRKIIRDFLWLLDLRNDISHQTNYSDRERTIEAIDRSQRVLNTCENLTEQDKDLKSWRDELISVTETVEDTNKSVWSKLDKRQRDIIESRSKTGYRRVKGSAGSGKTIIAAARAVEVAKANKSVLIVVYNRTMAARMRVMVEGCSQIAKRRDALSNIQIFSIYALFKKIVEWSDHDELLPRYDKNVKFETYEKELFKVATKALENEIGKRIAYFDCIIVDEGQDFTLIWWQFLRTLKISGNDTSGNALGEMLLIADATQDLYGTAHAWTEESMKGAGFRGDWLSLDKSYRMPSNLIPLAKDFVQTYLPNNQLNNIPQIFQDSTYEEDQLGFTFEFKWINAGQDPIDELLDAVRSNFLHGETRKAVIQAGGNSCEEIVQKLKNTEYNLNLRHTMDWRGLNSKDLFSIEDGQIGVITPHGFKGYEAPIVFLLLENFYFDRHKYAAYTAMTRVLKHDTGSKLIVINTTHQLQNLGKRWEALLRGEEPPIPGDVW